MKLSPLRILEIQVLAALKGIPKPPGHLAAIHDQCVATAEKEIAAAFRRHKRKLSPIYKAPKTRTLRLKHGSINIPEGWHHLTEPRLRPGDKCCLKDTARHQLAWIDSVLAEAHDKRRRQANGRFVYIRKNENASK